MKKLLFLLLGVFIVSAINAQDTNVVQNNNDDVVTIDSVKIDVGDNKIVIVSKEKKLEDGLQNLQEGLDDFEEKLELKQTEIEVWTDSIKLFAYSMKKNGENEVYELKIDSLEGLVDINEDIIEALKDGIEGIIEGIEDLTDELDDVSDDISDDFNYDYYYEEDDDIDFGKKKRKKFKGHWASMQLGLNSYVTSDYVMNLPAESDFMSVNQIQSREFSINPLQFSIPFFNKYVGAVTGLGFTFNNYEILQNIQLSVDAQGKLVHELDLETTYRKNRFKTSLLTVPLLLEIQIPVNKSDDRIFLSGGVIGSYTLSSKMKYVYYYRDNKIKIKDQSTLWPVNEWNYMATARIGFKNWYVYANYSFMPLFSTGNGPEIYPVSAGLALSF
ncbi:MAG: outer membrane beta-barrel protein [Bacteroidota bacterium]|nr:outer membrane beta-barrel protein [Bacteroidota bacterium]